MTTKPPYRVPSMRAIARRRGKNGLTIVSTFSGCGGSCLGFEMAGYRVAWASEFIPEARETYKANHPGVILDGSDIRDVRPQQIMDETGIGYRELDVLEGSPPCAAFSTAGKREKGWGVVKDYSSTKQRVDDLFFEYARLLEGLQPRAFVAENVSGMVKGVAKGYYKEVMARLRGCGYRVETRVLDAQWLGVPQARQRLIFIGLRDDVPGDIPWPSPLPYRYSIAEALDGLTYDSEDRSSYVHDTSGQFSSGEFTDRPSPTILVGPNALNRRHYQAHGHGLIETDPETGYRIALDNLAVGEAWDDLRPGDKSDRFFSLVRPKDTEPSPTITQRSGDRTVAGVTHPTQRRKFTLQELRRVCAFPDDFVLHGTYQQRWERLGRAVPPVMMAAVARELAGVLR